VESLVIVVLAQDALDEVGISRIGLEPSSFEHVFARDAAVADVEFECLVARNAVELAAMGEGGCVEWGEGEDAGGCEESGGEGNCRDGTVEEGHGGCFPVKDFVEGFELPVMGWPVWFRCLQNAGPG